MAQFSIRGVRGVRAGTPARLGAWPNDGGVNFCLYSSQATGVTLHLFDREADRTPSQSIPLPAKVHRTGDRWHVQVEGCQAGQLYLYSVAGRYLPRTGARCNRHKYLQDPYARAVCATPAIYHHSAAYRAAYGFDPGFDRGSGYGFECGQDRQSGQWQAGSGEREEADLSYSEQSNIDLQAKCIVVDDAFDWEGDRPLNYPLADCVIYEAHLKGMTQNCPYQNPGTYLGVIEHIPYLRKLGVSSLEFLPLMGFSPYDYSERRDPQSGKPLGLGNYWGYNTHNFFAPAPHYAASTAAGAALTEFKTMVRALHRAGIEIILDVVFNHSGEADELGPTLSFRGLDNQTYYILDENPRFYAKQSGCGNVMNCNHPVVRELIVDCLRYWVLEMHVDGFRFDLASILRRGQDAALIPAAFSVVEALSQDSVLAQTKLLAEPWDAGGAYLLGDFAQTNRGQARWAEWNDRYRDDIRRFWCASLGAAQLATRLAGSSDIFWRPRQRPYHSLNFLSCHDGFTLRDLFSYNDKHNWANGEQNRDGHNNNFNRNYGCEGPAEPHQKGAEIASLRCRMVKNHLATLLLSAGTPMLLAGDELGNTQLGNNNAYCQDNQLGWLQYDETQLREPGGDPEFTAYASLQRFAAQLIALRRRFPLLLRHEFFRAREIRWYGLRHDMLCELQNTEDWNSQPACLALLLDGSLLPADTGHNDSPSLFCVFNASSRLLNFPLPGKPCTQSPYSYGHWHCIVDTQLSAPADIRLPFGPYAVSEAELQSAIVLGNRYPVAARSSVLLMG